MQPPAKMWNMCSQLGDACLALRAYHLSNFVSVDTAVPCRIVSWTEVPSVTPEIQRHARYLCQRRQRLPVAAETSLPNMIQGLRHQRTLTTETLHAENERHVAKSWHIGRHTLSFDPTIKYAGEDRCCLFVCRTETVAAGKSWAAAVVPIQP